MSKLESEFHLMKDSTQTQDTATGLVRFCHSYIYPAFFALLFSVRLTRVYRVADACLTRAFEHEGQHVPYACWRVPDAWHRLSLAEESADSL